MSEIKKNNCGIIDQLCDLLKQTTNDQYSTKLEVFNNSSIGMHTRHILEFYTCFLNQIKKDHVCYDSRERQMIFEIDIPSTLSKFEEIKSQIQNLSINTAIKIKTNSSTTEGNDDYVQSSVGRELMYTLDHAIHHMAILKIGYQLNFEETNIPNDFGVAPSTIRHINKACAQ